MQFIHQMAKYFIQNNTSFLLLEGEDSHTLAGHSFLFQSCVRYLTMPEFNVVSKKDISDPATSFEYWPRSSDYNNCRKEIRAMWRTNTYPFLEYATLFWIDHWREVDKSRSLKFLSLCSDIGRRTKDGWTALYLATESGCEKAVGLLSDRGAEVNQVNGDSWSALHLAVNGLNFSIMRLLIANGANIKQKAAHNWTPLHFAVDRAYLEGIGN